VSACSPPRHAVLPLAFFLFEYTNPSVYPQHTTHTITKQVARYGGVYDRAEALKKQIMTVLEETKAPKVNIIGHSMGGLDARYQNFSR